MTSSVSTNPNQPQKLSFNYLTIGFFAVVHGLALLTPWFFSWKALGVTLFLHWLFGSIGICLGYHRLLSHRSLAVPQWFEYVLGTIGALALQGGPIFWVAGHRLHHAHTEDEEKDPYSAKRGFWWSHMMWMFYKRPQFFDFEQYKRYAPDLARDRVYCWLDRYHLVLQIPLGILLYVLGGWSFVICGMFLRAVLLWHSTWFINSVTHVWGYRTFDDIEDNSRNLWWAAIFTYGEGWHNNHHAFPNVAPAGWRWWEYDPTWWAIQVLRVVGLVQKVVLPPAHALEQR